jgi:hypothetical protein
MENSPRRWRVSFGFFSHKTKEKRRRTVMATKAAPA